MRDKKKSPKANLESKKIIFIEIGLVIALTATLVAFEWKSYEKWDFSLITRDIDLTEEDMVEITLHTPPPPPPPVPKPPIIIDIIKVDTEIDSDIEFNFEADQSTVIQAYIPVHTEVEPEDTQIHTVPESMPEFPGGDAARIRYLNDNIVYPQMARESGIQGRVFVTFVVERDGSVTDVRVLRGIGGGCDEEAVRVIRNMPNWIPGKQKGMPVRVQFNMPIQFKLN